ncbi:MAG: hypothetical protein RBU30_10395 [Polyangia bacterium]|jgi:tetratricopeptide (TPR) repeat protein|nr:hypothetical protein [Polyangia bacterium]
MDDPRRPKKDRKRQRNEQNKPQDGQESSPFEDSVPLHTGEVEILDDDFFDEALFGSSQGQPAQGGVEPETAIGQVPEQDVIEEEVADFGSDDLFGDSSLSFDGEDAVLSEEAFPPSGDDDLAVVDDLGVDFADDGAYASEDDGTGLLGADDYAEEAHRTPATATAPAPVEEPTEESWRTRLSLFKQESQKLALARKWTDLAELSRKALYEATWARKGADRVTLLLDLARLYRDRLSDSAHAEEVFAMLAAEDPTHSEALAFLAEQYRSTSNWQRLYELYLGAVAPTWDPNERLSRTKEAAEIALVRLEQPNLAIDAWEQLWNLKDAREEAERELLHLYRAGSHWNRLATFLTNKLEGVEGGRRSLMMREVAEVYLSGVGDRRKVLDVLNQILVQRPGDPVTLLTVAAVYSMEGDWEALSGLSDRTLEGVSVDVTLEFLRLIADAFWKAGEFDAAHDLYRRVLKQNPRDSQAQKAVEEYLAQTDRHEELLEFLEIRVARSKDEEEQLSVLSRMANIAQTNLGSPTRAASLWERCVALRPDKAEYHEALASLYDSMADLEGVARALEGQLATRRDPTGRIELLRMLGEHFAERLGDDERSERCWKEVLALSPEDYGARQQLLSIRRRRGDYEGLNAALEREMALTPDTSWRLELSRQAARNLDENFKDRARSVAAWQRVLDLAPTDEEALGALTKHFAGEESRAELVFALSRQIDAAHGSTSRIGLIRKMAELFRAADQPRTAAGAEEWILRLDPVEEGALAELDQYYGARDQVGKILGALENGSASADGLDARTVHLTRASERASTTARAGRFFWLRRLLGLKGGVEEVLDPLRQAAAAAELYGPLTEVFAFLAATSPNVEDRRRFQRELATLLENKVGEKARAYLELQALLLQAADADELVAELGRLSGETGRGEDYYALLGAVALATEDPQKRSTTLRARAKLADEILKDPSRAFEGYRALLALDNSDTAALAEMERIAAAAGLWQALDEVYAGLWDQTDLFGRLDLTDKRIALHREHLSDPAGAFDLALMKYRLAPDVPDLEETLLTTSADLSQWEYLLPILEASARSDSSEQRGRRLLSLGKLYEKHLSDAGHAFDLSAEALIADPMADEVLEALERLAGQVGTWDREATTLRAAAARCADEARKIRLYELAADIYWKHELGEQAAVMDRHILSARPDHRDALEALVAWHREREEWDVLRDLLVKRIAILEPGARVGAWLEVATISDQKLGQPEQALLAYTEVLALEPENEDAIRGFSALESSFTEPTQHVRKMRAELGRAEPQRALEIRLALAKLLEEELEDVAGAKDVLGDQIGIDGPVGTPYETLLRLHEQSKDWSALASLLELRAGKVEDDAEQLALLQQAIDIRHEHLAKQAPERLETLYREVLKRRPDDEIILGRLVEQLRAAARWEDMAALLGQVSERMDRPEDKARTKRELARVLHHGLGQQDQAVEIYKQLVTSADGDESAACALATFASERSAWADYVSQRQRQAKGLPARLAGLVYCHLAEVAEEKQNAAAQVSNHYRQARSLDANNQVAMEGLRAIGRRLKNWREVAALLPDADERELSFAERAARLRTRGDGALSKEPAQALDWYLRAAATWPDDLQAWAGVAKAATELGDRELAEAATARRLLAFERTVPPTAERLGDHVALITESAEQLMAAGQVDRARPLLRHAHELMPDFVPAALSVAEEHLEGGDAELALHVAGSLLERARDDLSERDKIRVLLCRARAALLLDSRLEAQEALRAVLSLRPLDGQALRTLADLLANSGRSIEAIQHYLRVLLVEEDAIRRGEVYRQMGFLWEDAIGNTYEGAACYDCAMDAGLDDPELLRRALRHLVRHREREKALAVVDALLPVTEDPKQMADLWVAQGNVFTMEGGDLEKATEAFDMALSYMPGYAPALMGLADVLEQREDWAQLLEILEASLELQPPEEQATSLRRMAGLYQDRLGDLANAENCLLKANAMEPTREALETLRAIYETDPAKHSERYLEVLAGLVEFGPPYFDILTRMGEIAFERGMEPWGWALHAPLANVRSASSEVKTRLRDLRKVYDKAELAPVPMEVYERVVRHRKVNLGLNEVLAAADVAIGPFGRNEKDEVGADASFKLSPNAGLGKTCAQVTEALKLPEAEAFRADGISKNWLVVNDPKQPRVMYLTEFLRQFVRAESSFLFGYTLEWIRPGQVVLAACDQDTREVLIAGVMLATGLMTEASPAATELADRLRQAVDGDTLAAWGEKLASLKGQSPAAVLQRHRDGIEATACRAGLIMAGDVLSAMRAWGRIQGTFDNPQGKDTEEMDEVVTANPALKDMLAFAASEAFGKLLPSP